MSIRQLSLDAGTQSFQYNVSQISSIVIVACNESFQATRKTVDGIIVDRIVIVGKDLYQVRIMVGAQQ